MKKEQQYRGIVLVVPGQGCVRPPRGGGGGGGLKPGIPPPLTHTQLNGRHAHRKHRSMQMFGTCPNEITELKIKQRKNK